MLVLLIDWDNYGFLQVGRSTAISLACFSKNLVSLDLSWCRNLTNEALGLIVDNCLSLRVLKLFGCSQVCLSGSTLELCKILQN